MDLAQLTGAPELTVTLGGQSWDFSELTLAHLGRLAAYLKRTLPDPWEHAVRRCKGLPDAVAAHILDSARKESLDWPPAPGTPEFVKALMETPAGRIEALREGLSIHHPNQAEEAEALHRLLQRDGATGGRVFAVLFGLPDPGRPSEDAAPKADAAAPSPGAT